MMTRPVPLLPAVGRLQSTFTYREGITPPSPCQPSCLDPHRITRASLYARADLLDLRFVQPPVPTAPGVPQPPAPPLHRGNGTVQRRSRGGDGEWVGHDSRPVLWPMAIISAKVSRRAAIFRRTMLQAPHAHSHLRPHLLSAALCSRAVCSALGSFMLSPIPLVSSNTAVASIGRETICGEIAPATG